MHILVKMHNNAGNSTYGVRLQNYKRHTWDKIILQMCVCMTNTIEVKFQLQTLLHNYVYAAVCLLAK